MARAAVAKSRSVGDNETGQSDPRPFHMSSQQRNGPSVNGENDNLSLSGLVYAPFINVDLWLTNTCSISNGDNFKVPQPTKDRLHEGRILK